MTALLAAATSAIATSETRRIMTRPRRTHSATKGEPAAVSTSNSGAT
ncbi:hypothetical protein STSO111631_19045 [Stackebrandtia soli]